MERLTETKKRNEPEDQEKPRERVIAASNEGIARI
jgi:hypothetical protein